MRATWARPGREVKQRVGVRVEGDRGRGLPGPQDVACGPTRPCQVRCPVPKATPPTYDAAGGDRSPLDEVQAWPCRRPWGCSPRVAARSLRSTQGQPIARVLAGHDVGFDPRCLRQNVATWHVFSSRRRGAQPLRDSSRGRRTRVRPATPSQVGPLIEDQGPMARCAALQSRGHASTSSSSDSVRSTVLSSSSCRVRPSSPGEVQRIHATAQIDGSCTRPWCASRLCRLQQGRGEREHARPRCRSLPTPTPRASSVLGRWLAPTGVQRIDLIDEGLGCLEVARQGHGACGSSGRKRCRSSAAMPRRGGP